jgi:hypothetical protein
MKKKIKIHFEGGEVLEGGLSNRKVEYINKFIDETPIKWKEGGFRNVAQYADIGKASSMELKFYQAIKVDERFDKHDLEVQRILTPVRYGMDDVLPKQVGGKEVKANFSEAALVGKINGRKRGLDDCLLDKNPLPESFKMDKAVQTNILPSIRDVFPDLLKPSSNVYTSAAVGGVNKVSSAKIKFQGVSIIAEKKWGNAEITAENKKENGAVSRFV